MVAGAPLLVVKLLTLLEIAGVERWLLPCSVLFGLYLGVHAIVFVSRLRDDEGFLTPTSVFEGLLAQLGSFWDEFGEAWGAADALPGSLPKAFSRILLYGAILFVGIAAILTQVGVSETPPLLNKIGFGMLGGSALVFLIAWRIGKSRASAGDPNRRALGSPDLSKMEDEASALHGRVFDLRNSERWNDVLSHVPVDARLLRILEALQSWNPRVTRNVHEHRYRDSIVRHLERKLKPEWPVHIRKEYPLPSAAGRASRRADIALDEALLIEVKREVRPGLHLDQAVEQVCDYAARWGKGPVILAVGLANSTFEGDVAPALAAALRRMESHTGYRCPVFAIAIGYKTR
jgi:hypothetical protein